jgi:hypothetical protein
MKLQRSIAQLLVERREKQSAISTQQKETEPQRTQRNLKIVFQSSVALFASFAVNGFG